MAGFVQQKSGNGSGTSVTITFDGTPAAGNWLHVITNGTVNSVKCNGVSFTKEAGAGTLNNASHWSLESIAGGTAAIVFTMSGRSGGPLAAIMLEVAGVDAASALDKTATASGTIETTFSSGTTATTAQANEFLVAGWAWSVGVYASGPTNGFTRLTAAAQGTALLEAGYKIVTATGDYESGMTVDTAGALWTGAIATYKYTPSAAFTKLAGRGGLAGVGGVMVGPGGLAG